nr:putative leucine-rich repeat receptor-like protein kinase At2g19210 [Ziziphus jujuba var. spinosa]
MYTLTYKSLVLIKQVKLLMRVYHGNLTSLVGYCNEGTKMALIYEYMANGNLESYLYADGSENVLSWQGRLQVALDAAQGLEYLHSGCKPPIVHRDVKTSNVY